MSSVGVLCLLYICLSKHSVWISSVLQRLLFLFSSSLCFVLVLLCLSSVIYFSLVINCLSHGGVFCQFICNVCHTTLIYNSTLRLCTTCTVCTLRLCTMCTVFLVCEQILWFHRRNSSKSNFSSANLTLIIFFIVVNNFLQWLANFCGESDAGLHRLMWVVMKYGLRNNYVVVFVAVVGLSLKYTSIYNSSTSSQPTSVMTGELSASY